jgi:beta-hydroxylase
MFFDTEAFSAARSLEAGFDEVLRELQELHIREFVPWPERYLYGDGWSVFGLYQSGEPIDYACRLCPNTAGLLASIDGLSHAGFSRLAAHTHIKSHMGRPKTELRCHLGLIVPAGDVCIRVDDAIESWQEGKCLIFDDTREHEAWNNSSEDRIVLLVDIPRANGAG